MYITIKISQTLIRQVKSTNCHNYSSLIQNRELNDANLLTRQRAVRSLSDYLHDPENIATALSQGIAMSLKKLLKDNDVTIREKSLECLHTISREFASLDARLAKYCYIAIFSMLSKFLCILQSMLLVGMYS